MFRPACFATRCSDLKVCQSGVLTTFSHLQVFEPGFQTCKYSLRYSDWQVFHLDVQTRNFQQSVWSCKCFNQGFGSENFDQKFIPAIFQLDVQTWMFFNYVFRSGSLSTRCSDLLFFFSNRCSDLQVLLLDVQNFKVFNQVFRFANISTRSSDLQVLQLCVLIYKFFNQMFRPAGFSTRYSDQQTSQSRIQTCEIFN